MQGLAVNLYEHYSTIKTLCNFHGHYNENGDIHAHNCISSNWNHTILHNTWSMKPKNELRRNKKGIE
jgi:hypothetical protein